jgi:hypothetical protein
LRKLKKILLGLAIVLIVILLVSLKPWLWFERSKVALAAINGVQELQNEFNQDMGKIRLILILSPT